MYIATLFEYGRQQQTNPENIEGESDPDIIKNEVIYALNIKPVGPDQLMQAENS